MVPPPPGGHVREPDRREAIRRALDWARRRRHGGDRGEGPRDLSDHRRPRSCRSTTGWWSASSSPAERAKRAERRRAAPESRRAGPRHPGRARRGTPGDARHRRVDRQPHLPPRDAFFAIRGATQDGHAFVAHARMRGRRVRVTSRIPPGLGAEAGLPGGPGGRHDGGAPAAGRRVIAGALRFPSSGSLAPTGRPRRRSWSRRCCPPAGACSSPRGATTTSGACP